MKRREEMSFLERIYIIEILKGLSVTFYKLIRNFCLHILHIFGILKNTPAMATVEYPNEKREHSKRLRTRHRLTLNPDGSIRCTSCFLCATACPAKCIYIEPAEHDDPEIEKFPHRYEIDTLLCIYCGYCVEACPVDAIRMDTGIHPQIYPPDPKLFIEDKELLMQRSRVLDDLGRDALYQEHLNSLKEIEASGKLPSEPLETEIFYRINSRK